MKKVYEPLGFKYGSGKGWRYAWHKDDPAKICSISYFFSGSFV